MYVRTVPSFHCMRTDMAAYCSRVSSFARPVPSRPVHLLLLRRRHRRRSRSYNLNPIQFAPAADRASFRLLCLVLSCLLARTPGNGAPRYESEYEKHPAAAAAVAAAQSRASSTRRAHPALPSADKTLVLAGIEPAPRYIGSYSRHGVHRIGRSQVESSNGRAKEATPPTPRQRRPPLPPPTHTPKRPALQHDLPT
ncbi:uncharacterized protein K452DRAFT_48526 [Aplosporella prunicola CBS 121167]|uniref:Uncharacterized protein n=1 Tax=Aplosporella prunicola CBS 121167 TaxID=1176127 RepID=A0A6A6BBE6_9PEZI|nr:uncharacterized protein K452DRAFT_48526 [Aplosporella prunicola CBS 121167]KAF2140584.1 hypothetical protein K452DRAFT_48526 [Aplosporella prunicola CBS 121167]